MVDSASRERGLSGPGRLIQLLHGKIVAQAICAAAELRVADHLGEEPESYERLAAATGTHAGSLYRLLRLLASLGIFTELEGKKFAHTADSLFLKSTTPGSVQPMARVVGAPWHSEAETRILHSLRRGEPAFKSLHGMEVFEYLGKHEDAGQIFNDAMTGLSEATNQAVVRAYDFASASTVVDVGGGRGSLLLAILRAHPHLRGIVYDTPAAVRGAHALARAAGLPERCDFREGSFFESVPSGGDLYLLKYILHDWSDDDASKILSTCRKAMSSEAKLLVVEDLIGAPNAATNAKLTDLEMLVIFGGRERTIEEYMALFRKSGLKLGEVRATAAPISVLEVTVA